MMLTDYNVRCPYQGCHWRGCLFPRNGQSSSPVVTFSCPSCQREWPARIVNDDVEPLLPEGAIAPPAPPVPREDQPPAFADSVLACLTEKPAPPVPREDQPPEIARKEDGPPVRSSRVTPWCPRPDSSAPQGLKFD